MTPCQDALSIEHYETRTGSQMLLFETNFGKLITKPDESLLLHASSGWEMHHE